MPAVAAAAYILLPISGLIALAFARTPRVRAHGAQAIAFGLLWSLALFGASAIGSTVTQLVFAAGAVLYLVLIGATLAGRDLLLGFFARYGDLERD